MVLESQKTTIAYRCPKCFSWVKSVVGVFSLSAKMIRLKCSCGGSDALIEYTNDEKIRFTIPCITCPKPHNYVVVSKTFLNREFMAFPCYYSGFDICMIGDDNTVNEAIIVADDALYEALEQADSEQFSNAMDNAKNNVEYIDPQVAEIIDFTLKDLDEAGEISCNCPKDEGLYSVSYDSDGVLIECENCGAKKHLPITSVMSAQAFLDCTHLDLK